MSAYRPGTVHNYVVVPWFNPEVGMDVDVKIQFKYGDCWNIIYRVGDEVRWGGNDLGDPSIRAVVVDGVPSVDFEGLPELFEIYIVDNKIQKVVPWGGQIDWGQEYYLIIPLDKV